MRASGSKINDYDDVSDGDPATDVTGAELEDLTDGGESAGHTHAAGPTSADYDDISSNDAATDVSGAELEELTDTSETTLHSHAVGASEITMARIAGSTYSTVQHLQDIFHSAGWVSGGIITDDTDGTITVAAGTGLIRANDTATDQILFCNWAAESGANVDLADNDISYVYVEYNFGSPRVIATVTKRTDFNKNVLLAVVSREGTVLHINQTDQHTVGDHANSMIRRLKGVQPYGHVSGAILSETGTRNIAVTAGDFWRGLTQFATSAIDTSGVPTFSYYYNDGAWQKVTPVSDIHQTNYNDFGTGLDTLSNNKYGVHWVYLEADSDDLAVVYGIGDYTLSQAENAQPPSALPQHLQIEGILVGKIIIKEGGTAFTQVESAFQTKFVGSIASDHGDLAGLQGGTANEYYHLTSAEEVDLTDGGETTLHSHAAGGSSDDHSDISANDGATDVTGAELEELTDASETTLHSHAGGGAAPYQIVHTGKKEHFAGNNGKGQSAPAYVEYEQSAEITGTRTSATVFTRSSGTWIVDALIGQYAYSYNTSALDGIWLPITDNTTTTLTVSGTLFAACDSVKTSIWNPIYDEYAHGRGTTAAFEGGVFDGESIWLAPYRSTDIAKVDPADGSMVFYAHGQADFSFIGAVFDGESVWLVPSNSANVLKINPADGSLTPYAHGKGATAFAGGIFDGTNIWLIPRNSDDLVKLDPSTGVMTSYAHGKGDGAFRGGCFDGTSLWLAPNDSDDLVKVDISDGGMTSYAHGKGNAAFMGAIWDGESVWLIPAGSADLVKVDISDGGMTDYTINEESCNGGWFDGESVWLAPHGSHNFKKINPATGAIMSFAHGHGNTGFAGSIFDGKNVWMVPSRGDDLVRLIPPRFGRRSTVRSLTGLERGIDPPQPAEGEFVIWMSNGSGYGDDGDICIASQAGGATKKAILFDHSGGDAW